MKPHIEATSFSCSSASRIVEWFAPDRWPTLRRLNQLGVAAARVTPLYITVDPERDTPERIREFLEAAYPLFTGLTGSRREVEHMCRQFPVFVRRVEKEGGAYDMPHSAFTYVLNADGGFVEHWLDAISLAKVVSLLEELLATR